MRTLSRAALTLSGVLALTGVPATSQADFPTRTNVVVKVAASVERDGAGVIKVPPRVEGDAALCTGAVHLTIRHAGEVVFKRSKPVSQRVRFRVNGLDAGRHQLTGEYRIGDRDPCDVSKDRKRIQVR